MRQVVFALAVGVILLAGRFSPAASQAIISAPGFDFTKVPKKTFKFAEFMHHIGGLKTKPESWEDLYFARGARARLV
jgi:hypothetical protein